MKIGKYNIETKSENKRFFVQIKVKEDGEDKVKTVPCRKIKKTLILQHESGDIVTFSSYKHRGATFYRDSRSKTSKHNDSSIVEEIVRMLSIEKNEARKMISME